MSIKLPIGMDDNIYHYLGNCENDEELIEKLGKKPRYLINFVTTACDPVNHWDVEKNDLVNRLIGTIEESSLKGDLSVKKAKEISLMGLSILKAPKHCITISTPRGSSQINKTLLASLSPVFRDLLNNNPTAIQLDVKPKIEEQFLSYLKNGTLPNLVKCNKSELEDFIVTSQKYKLDGLKEKSLNALSALPFSETRVFDQLRIALEYQSKQLRDQCFRFVEEKTGIHLTSDNFKQVNLSISTLSGPYRAIHNNYIKPLFECYEKTVKTPIEKHEIVFKPYDNLDKNDMKAIVTQGNRIIKNISKCSRETLERLKLETASS